MYSIRHASSDRGLVFPRIWRVPRKQMIENKAKRTMSYFLDPEEYLPFKTEYSQYSITLFALIKQIWKQIFSSLLDKYKLFKKNTDWKSFLYINRMCYECWEIGNRMKLPIIRVCDIASGIAQRARTLELTSQLRIWNLHIFFFTQIDFERFCDSYVKCVIT